MTDKLIIPRQLEELAEEWIRLSRRLGKHDLLSKFANEPKMNKKQVYAMLEKRNVARRRDVCYAMSDFIDFLIDIHDITRMAIDGYQEHMEKRLEEEEEYTVLIQEWYRSVKKAVDAGGATDYFGELYEEHFKGKGKADALGQFFTPMSLCEIMSRLVNPDIDEREEIMACDPCCGSGRLLLGYIPQVREAVVREEKYHFFFAGDVDVVSVKMCALNLMVHGVSGLVVLQNALTMEKPVMGYVVNPLDFPVRTGRLSLLPLTQDECAEITDWKEGEIYHDNFRQWQAKQKYVWEYVHRKKNE